MTKKKDPNAKPKKNGRPIKDIDYKKLDSLCFIHCTGVEIAAILEMSYESLNEKLKKERGVGFLEYFAEKSAGGKMSLRRKQYTMAQTNPTMSIWLGKNWLSQTDKTEIDHKSSDSSMSPKDNSLAVLDAIKNKYNDSR